MSNLLKRSKLDKAVSDLANGDKSALSIIYDLTARLMFSVAYSIVENYQDAEDVMQETFIQIDKYVHSYKGTGAKAWILSMTRHLSIDVIRKRKSSSCIEDLAGEECSFLAVNDDYSKLEVSDMLNLLTTEERQIIIYRVYGKLPHREIAQILDISETNAQKKYRRTLEKLRKEWYKFDN